MKTSELKAPIKKINEESKCRNCRGNVEPGDKCPQCGTKNKSESGAVGVASPQGRRYESATESTFVEGTLLKKPSEVKKGDRLRIVKNQGYTHGGITDPSVKNDDDIVTVTAIRNFKDGRISIAWKHAHGWGARWALKNDNWGSQDVAGQMKAVIRESVTESVIDAVGKGKVESVPVRRFDSATGLNESQPWLQVDKQRDPFDIMREECNAIVAEDEEKEKNRLAALDDVSKRLDEVRDNLTESEFFTDYDEAYAYARKKAKQLNHDYGLEKKKEYGKSGYSVKMLPSEKNSFGHELRMQRVKPTESSKKSLINTLSESLRGAR